MDININIKVGEEPKVSIKKTPQLMSAIKRKVKPLKHGVESILKTPDVVNPRGNDNILNILGI